MISSAASQKPIFRPNDGTKERKSDLNDTIKGEETMTPTDVWQSANGKPK